MKFTFNWLKDHLRTESSYHDIADKLPCLGLEVEEVIDYSAKFENFVVGFIRQAEQHPNADRLKVCTVDIGSKILQIVCGAPNARAEIYVAVALEGAIIPATGLPLKAGVIRGVESQGMMCSSSELLVDISHEADGIVELQSGLVVGQGLASALGTDDVIFDVSLTPNRADCYCVRGIARDLAAAGVGELIPLSFQDPIVSIDNPVEVDITTSGCYYFSTTAVDGVAAETPAYIARRLRAIGQRLIGLPVDVANYICIDIGVPLHIFDMDKLQQKLVVRDANGGEMLKTLDGKDTVLSDKVVIISTEDRPLSVAGIMGGLDSAYSPTDTRRILIEGAYFDKVAISIAGQTLRISSEARTRCERGVDPEAINTAVRYTASLIAAATAGNCKVSATKKHGSLPANKSIIELTLEKFKALTNMGESDFTTAVPILENLGLTIQSATPTRITVETPSWRHDLEIEEDLIEEVLRIMGFENVENVELSTAEPIQQICVVDKITDAMVYNNYDEVKTFPFTSWDTAALFVSEGRLLTLKDAAPGEASTLRPSVVLSHLNLIKNAQNKSQKNSRVFEVGACFCREDSSIVEDNTLTATISEKLTSRNWRIKQEDVSVFDVKEILEKILNMVTSNVRLSGGAPRYYHPGRSGSYVIQKDTVIAYFGEIHPTILRRFDIVGPVACFEIFIGRLPGVLVHKTKPQLVVSQYQPVTRDFSFIVQKSMDVANVTNAIRRLKLCAVRDIKVFDVYESDEIGDFKKAVAIEVTMQSDDGTLSVEQISDISTRIIDAVSKSCGGQLRDK
ncbi:MAG: phenylalanine--tRNA ligase subunit beta [Holosporales bacterium]|jgi:phenylalanyl-tRNA synthetase beta chain|nr:phenylalanine--tRNA ligase subunit beta [Holosporales bacterium]